MDMDDGDDQNFLDDDGEDDDSIDSADSDDSSVINWDDMSSIAGNEPIHFAARRGDLSEVQRLATEDPSLIDLRGARQQSPLIEAATEGHAAIVEWLIDHGVEDVDAQGWLGTNGLLQSSQQGHLEVVSLLLNKGADINYRDMAGWSPLMAAARYGHLGVVEILLSQEGIDLDAQDNCEWTALWDASNEVHEEVIRLLLAAGADPRIAGEDGRIPLYKAREGDRDECIRLLEAALAAPERARLLHRIRSINDAHHAINKVAGETEGMDEEERKRKLVAAAPAYLKGRVGRGEELPQAEVIMHEEEKVAAVAEHMLIGGQVATEVFTELMKMMVPKWDDERRRV